jgi:hypothetical protein
MYGRLLVHSPLRAHAQHCAEASTHVTSSALAAVATSEVARSRARARAPSRSPSPAHSGARS